MTDRLQQFLSHLKPGSSALAAATQKSPDDVVITLAVRTPLTRARKGGMKDTTLEHMLLRLYQVRSTSGQTDDRVFSVNPRLSPRSSRISSLETVSIPSPATKFEYQHSLLASPLQRQPCVSTDSAAQD